MIMGLAPMDGITDLPYRCIVKKVFDKYNIDHELWLWTEFMNADGYMTHPARLIKHLICTDFDTPLFAQIYGGNEDTLIKTAQDIERKYPYFTGIELNIGCPSPKVMSCGGGSGMMKDKKRCLEIIKNISSGLKMPFSIKVRTGLDDADKIGQFDMLCEASKYCHTISVHGRTFRQGHSSQVDWDFIYRLKKAVGNTCKIIGNGGILSYQDAMDHSVSKDGTELDGIMIAQSAIADPWIFVDHKPDNRELYEVIVDHLRLSIAYEIGFKAMMEKYPDGVDDVLSHNRNALHYKKKIEDDDSLVSEITDVKLHDYKIPFPSLDELNGLASVLDEKMQYRSIIEFRKYLFNYVKGIPGSKEFKQEIARISDYGTLLSEIDKFFGV